MWNYRVMRNGKDDSVWYGIYEVYYDDDGEIYAWTAEPQEPFGNTPEELRHSLGLMVLALDKPILFLNDTPKGTPPYESAIMAIKRKALIGLDKEDDVE